MNNGVSYTSTKPLEEFKINKKNKPSDLLSRLSELRSQYSCFDESERDTYHTLSEAIEALKEQKTGQWIENEDWYDTYYECSSCGEAFSLIVGTPKDNGYNYCPHCGARMVGEEHER